MSEVNRFGAIFQTREYIARAQYEVREAQRVSSDIVVASLLENVWGELENLAGVLLSLLPDAVPSNE